MVFLILSDLQACVRWLCESQLKRERNHLLLYSRYITPSFFMWSQRTMCPKSHEACQPKTLAANHSENLNFENSLHCCVSFSFPWMFSLSLSLHEIPPNIGMCGFERSGGNLLRKFASPKLPIKLALSSLGRVYVLMANQHFYVWKNQKRFPGKILWFLALLQMENGRGALIIFSPFYHIPSCCLHFSREILCPVND